MDPVRIETYRGLEIRIFVWPDVGQANAFVGMYEVHSEQTHRGVVAGGFVNAELAEHAALEGARRWIDEDAAKN